VLCCAVLCCAVLCCAVLCCAVGWSAQQCNLLSRQAAWCSVTCSTESGLMQHSAATKGHKSLAKGATATKGH